MSNESVSAESGVSEEPIVEENIIVPEDTKDNSEETTETYSSNYKFN